MRILRQIFPGGAIALMGPVIVLALLTFPVMAQQSTALTPAQIAQMSSRQVYAYLRTLPLDELQTLIQNIPADVLPEFAGVLSNKALVILAQGLDKQAWYRFLGALDKQSYLQLVISLDDRSLVTAFGFASVYERDVYVAENMDYLLALPPTVLAALLIDMDGSLRNDFLAALQFEREIDYLETFSIADLGVILDDLDTGQLYEFINESDSQALRALLNQLDAQQVAALLGEVNPVEMEDFLMLVNQSVVEEAVKTFAPTLTAVERFLVAVGMDTPEYAAWFGFDREERTAFVTANLALLDTFDPSVVALILLDTDGTELETALAYLQMESLAAYMQTLTPDELAAYFLNEMDSPHLDDVVDDLSEESTAQLLTKLAPVQLARMLETMPDDNVDNYVLLIGPERFKDVFMEIYDTNVLQSIADDRDLGEFLEAIGLTDEVIALRIEELSVGG